MTEPVRRYGCFNRPPLAEMQLFQVGWEWRSKDVFDTARDAVFVWFPDTMSKDCQYSISTADRRCAGCAHYNFKEDSR